jgi:LAO/AO transport system kinase
MNTNNGYIEENRRNQGKNHFYSTLQENLLSRFFSDRKIIHSLSSLETEVTSGKLSPYAAAKTLLDKYLGE